MSAITENVSVSLALRLFIALTQGFIQPFVSGGSMKLSGGTIEWLKGHESRRETPSRGGIWGGGVPLPRDGGPVVSRENFEI